MNPFRAFKALAIGFGLFIQYASGHSTPRNPLSYVSRIDDAILHTPSHRVHALSSFDLSFYLHDRQQRIRLSLAPNHDILSEDATVNYLGADGTIHAVEPIDRLAHRIFRGEAFVQHGSGPEWEHVGWARINVHRDGESPVFEGAFRVGGNHHHIQTSTNYMHMAIVGDPEIEPTDDEYMVVWRDSDVQSMAYGYGENDELKRDGSAGEPSCSSDRLRHNRDENNLAYRGLGLAEETSTWSISPRVLFGRQIDGTTTGNSAGVNLTSTIGSSAGCPNTRQVALVGIATDCTYTQAFNSTAAVRANIIQQVNTASQVYESTFNISLGIQNLTISNATCPPTPSAAAPWNVDCSSPDTITDRLNLFSAWRGQFQDTNAYWSLFSTCNTGADVGLAWLGQVCTPGSSTSGNETVAATNVVVRTSTEWQVFAHETGHIFGAVHDCIAETCSDGTVTMQQCCPLSASTCNANGVYIMNPSTGSAISNFSPCSVGNICGFLQRSSAQATCLTNNKNVITITGSQCGNGIVEAGEECDCGGPSGCGSDSCCDPTTCKYTANSVCDPANEDCCTSSCQFAANATVCRPSTGSCDPQEVCTGTSATCPPDQMASDGTTCGASGAGLACASGQCTSRDLQCKVLMGGLTTDNDTYSCSSQGCTISCASPQFGSACYTMNQYFLSGTPCEDGGTCSNGNCVGASVGDEIRTWLADNQQIVIPVAASVGALVLIAAALCCLSCWRRRRQRKGRGRPAAATVRKPPQMSRGGGGGGGGGGGTPPPPYKKTPPSSEFWAPPGFRYA